MTSQTDNRNRVLLRALVALVGLSAAPGAAAQEAGQAVDWDGGSWRVEDIRGRGVIDSAQTTLAIDADGVAWGSTGCNRFRGRAIISGDGLRFGPLATTYLACVPALADQERKFLNALKEARKARFDGARLRIFSQSGAVLLILTRM